MIFVFLCRQVFDDYSSRQWKDYDYDDYVFNKRAFGKWMSLDIDVMHESTLLDGLGLTTTRRPKRKPSRVFASSQEQRRKKVFSIDIDMDMDE